MNQFRGNYPYLIVSHINLKVFDSFHYMSYFYINFRFYFVILEMD